MYPHLFYESNTKVTLTLSEHNKEVNIMGTMKGVKKMNWFEAYEHNPEAEIEATIKSLYEAKNWEELHIALWTWLAMDGERGKYEWFIKFNVPEVRNHCFACVEAASKEEEEGEDDLYSCRYCPITDPAAEYCLDGLYEKWLARHYNDHLIENEMRNSEELTETLLENGFRVESEELAMEIANLEWK